VTTVNHTVPTVALPAPSASIPEARQPLDALIGSPERIPAALSALRARLDAAQPTNIGFPSTLDLDITPLLPFLNMVLNNVGDPDQAAVFPAHTKDFEREVVDIIASLLHAPADDRWGYVTSGGSEGVEYGLLLARTLYPDAVTYASATAHWAVPKILSKLGMPLVTVRALPDGRMDRRDLRVALRQHRDRPAVVVANIGTTMSEAVDDVTAIRRILTDTPISRAFIHADAALSGLPLALVPPDRPVGFDLADGADCISISGHKFLGAPFPCGNPPELQRTGSRTAVSRRCRAVVGHSVRAEEAI
jgi:histidine decarboxylase